MTNVQIDGIDARILRHLHKSGRASVQEISDQVGLSPSPVARRIRALEESGVITGYAALLDETALGYGVSVFVSVQLDRQVDEALAKFETAVRAFPEVVDCWLMTGSRDYLLRVVTASLADFESFLTGRLTRVPGVSTIESSIPLRRVKGGISRMP
ncbi:MULTISPECIES: Lrp/AsnC family transcriptional regulator [Paracoccus]|jgi:Lrp/AsnC family leucine-responsive transcriptional regulator|uniref:AsnC family transcriptional regulator n=1 Tax=Paracoccus litorisediminis TaxID=2006130 RepID=A0A844HNN5_9RHOB|nr:MULTISPECIES: Lrp/AsnC family transcriptional regulator [Paracoccus]MBD9527094.1 Lrp/AsnC family transcriptional regulator [Paracoccus sp. PAR01]MTH59341.1 AsnC family transcriptional regulator [Paracoccus litorisediminis]